MPLLEQTLTLRKAKLGADHPYMVTCMIGLGQRKYAEAEPLLLQGYDGIKQHEAQIAREWRQIFLTEALDRLVQLYEATGKPDEAAKWRTKREVTKAAAKLPTGPP